MKTFKINSLLLLSVLSSHALAEQTQETSKDSVATESHTSLSTDKKWSVGIGSYATVISVDEYGSEDDEFTGGSITVRYAATENIALSAVFYGLEHEDVSAIEVSGIDLLVYAGNNFMSEGFKYYGGVGFYSETLEVGSFEEDFSGFQLNGGIGYNWEHVALDLTLGIRSTGDYEDFTDASDVTAVSSSLSLAYRF